MDPCGTLEFILRVLDDLLLIENRNNSWWEWVLITNSRRESGDHQDLLYVWA